VILLGLPEGDRDVCDLPNSGLLQSTDSQLALMPLILPRQSRELAQRGHEACFVVWLPTLHDLDDFAHDHAPDQPSGVLGRVPSLHEAIERLPSFHWCSLTQLVVDDLKDRGVEYGIRRQHGTVASFA
jgi:hypothetical protein